MGYLTKWFLTIFSANEYRPRKDNLKLGVVVTRGMKLKKEASEVVRKEIIPGFKALSYTHVGSPALVSMMWKQMRDYIQRINSSHVILKKNYKGKHKIKRDYSLPFFELEFYFKTALNDFHDEDLMISELNMPMV